MAQLRSGAAALSARRSGPRARGGATRGARVRIELLRSFALAQAGRIVRLPLSVQRVVAFVALAGRPLQRLYVAGNLWLDSSEEHANASLRTALWRLGHTGLRVIESTGTQIALHDGVEVDVREIAAEAELAIAGAPPASARLPALCSPGELLPDWYDDWVVMERERIRQLRLHGLEALCASLSAEGRFGEAVVAGTAAVAGEPLRESAHRVLIETYLAEGNGPLEFVYTESTPAGLAGLMVEMTDREPSQPLVPARAALLLEPHPNQHGYGVEVAAGFGLHQVGGYTPWLELDRHPACPRCSRSMPFLAAIDSGLTQLGTMRFSGMLYGFWCDDCRVSCTTRQVDELFA